MIQLLLQLAYAYILPWLRYFLFFQVLNVGFLEVIDVIKTSNSTEIELQLAVSLDACFLYTCITTPLQTWVKTDIQYVYQMLSLQTHSTIEVIRLRPPTPYISIARVYNGHFGWQKNGYYRIM